AEDGIRDFHVTGVQTCALPISIVFPTERVILTRANSSLMSAIAERTRFKSPSGILVKAPRNFSIVCGVLYPVRSNFSNALFAFRSEERRVGKGCRVLWSRSLLR